MAVGLPAVIPASAAAAVNDRPNGDELKAGYAAFADALSMLPDGGSAGGAGGVVVELGLPSALALVREHGVCVDHVRVTGCASAGLVVQGVSLERVHLQVFISSRS